MESTYHFKSTDLATPYNLAHYLSLAGWKASLPAAFTDKNLELAPTACIALEEKHRLAALLLRHRLDVMPTTLCLDEDNALAIINTLPEYGAWILKPALLNNGEGIHLFSSRHDLQAHYQQSKRYGGPHVLQHYISNPHLLQGHKYSLRMFCVISNFCAPQLYPKGYFNVTKTTYAPDDFSNLNAHLTNEHLAHESGANNWQIPTDRHPDFEPIYQQIKTIIQQVMQAVINDYPELRKQHLAVNAFSLFGFDFMVDDHARVWLLEINHGPCFPKDHNHPLQAYVYDGFWQAVVSQFSAGCVDKTFGAASKKCGFELISVC